MAHGVHARVGEVRVVCVTQRHPGVPEPVLDGVSLLVPAGEALALVGPAAAGKTALLHLVSGVEPPADGRVLLDGEDVAGLSPRRRGVAVVGGYRLYPFLDVAANVAFGLRADASPPPGRGLPSASPAGTARRVRDALELVGLGDYARRRPPQLAPSHRQRAAIARALVTRPRVLLLDDPLAQLPDEAPRVRLGEDLRLLHRQLGITMIYATRSGDEASAVADRVAVLSGGRLLLEARPAQDATVRPESPANDPAAPGTLLAPADSPQAGAPAA